MKERCSIRTEIAWRKMKDGTITIVSPITDKIITINRTAALVWEMLDGTKTVEEIAESVAGKFCDDPDLDKQIIFNDVKEIIEAFDERGLLE